MCNVCTVCYSLMSNFEGELFSFHTKISFYEDSWRITQILRHIQSVLRNWKYAIHGSFLCPSRYSYTVFHNIKSHHTKWFYIVWGIINWLCQKNQISLLHTPMAYELFAPCIQLKQNEPSIFDPHLTLLLPIFCFKTKSKRISIIDTKITVDSSSPGNSAIEWYYFHPA
jgi:hypothetical protein